MHAPRAGLRAHRYAHLQFLVLVMQSSVFGLGLIVAAIIASTRLCGIKTGSQAFVRLPVRIAAVNRDVVGRLRWLRRLSQRSRTCWPSFPKSKHPGNSQELLLPLNTVITSLSQQNIEYIHLGKRCVGLALKENALAGSFQSYSHISPVAVRSLSSQWSQQQPQRLCMTLDTGVSAKSSAVK